MKLQYFGTAAAEGVPAPFCECPVCEAARKKGGRNVRTRSQALVDGRLLLDFSADTYTHVLHQGLRLWEIDSVLITHCHSDHIYPGDLWCLMECAAHRKTERPFHLYGAAPTLEKVRAQCDDIEAIEGRGALELHLVKLFQPFTVEGFRVTPLRADHGAPEAFVYMLEKDGKAMLYAHDTGLLPQDSMEYLAKAEVKFDLISYDCTNGLLELDNRSHMGLTGDVQLREALRQLGRVTEETVHVVNHFSHNGKAGYDELAPVAEEKGFLVSYDGMEVEF